MWRVFLVVLFLTISISAFASCLKAQEEAKSAQAGAERITTAEEVSRFSHPAAAAPLRFVFYPFHVVNKGMESGLISFEKHRMRERLNYWTEYLRERGLAVLFGGMGEGSGMGLGGSYTMQTGAQTSLQFLGRGSLARGYQEVDVRWNAPTAKTRFELEGSYQWRPHENFYGLGMDSREDQRTKFALRQTWAGARFELLPLMPWTQRMRLGGEYKQAWLFSTRSPDTLYAPPDVLFPGLQGFGQHFRLQSAGFYVDADGIRGEYRTGGRVHFGASYQDGLAESRIEYLSLEGMVEGRMPIVEGRSGLAFQGELEFNRPRGGSDPIPFFLLPHIGGSSTLRGFNLDRFYGKNIFFLTLEYRYQVHPNYQAFIFFDEGQMFEQTSDLSWLNWQRNYGFGIKMHSSRGAYFRFDFGYSEEGIQYHILWGDRAPRPLGGAIRYGTYRR